MRKEAIVAGLLAVLSLAAAVRAETLEPCDRISAFIAAADARRQAYGAIGFVTGWHKIGTGVAFPDPASTCVKGQDCERTIAARVDLERLALRHLELRVEAQLQKWLAGPQVEHGEEESIKRRLLLLRGGLQSLRESISKVACIESSGDETQLSYVYPASSLQKEAIAVLDRLSKRVEDFAVEAALRRIDARTDRLKEAIGELDGRSGRALPACDRGGPMPPGARRIP